MDNENEKTKQFKSKNAEYVKNYNSKYYQKTKAKRLADMKEKLHCDLCDCNVSKGRLQKHQKTKKHLSKIPVKDDTDDDTDDSDE